MSGRWCAVVLLAVCLISPAHSLAAERAVEKRSPPPVVRQAPVAPPVNVNVTVNVHVSRDVNVDVKIDAPFTPVIGTLQIPEVVQRLLGNFLFKSPSPPPSKAAPAPAKK